MNNFYKTRDLSESAALAINNIKLVSIERVGKVCWFVFENSNRCKEISDKFFFGELPVNAHTYYEVLTKLKNRIFAGR